MKEAIWERYATLAHIFSALLLKHAKAQRMNVVFMSSGADTRTYELVEHFFPSAWSSFYRKLTVYLDIDKISAAERSVRPPRPLVPPAPSGVEAGEGRSPLLFYFACSPGCVEAGGWMAEVRSSSCLHFLCVLMEDRRRCGSSAIRRMAFVCAEKIMLVGLSWPRVRERLECEKAGLLFWFAQDISCSELRCGSGFIVRRRTAYLLVEFYSLPHS